MEDDPVLKINFANGRKFESRANNTSLFTFAGSLAMYNHVFFVISEEENKGTYLFAVHPVYKDVVDFIMENNFPTHMNMVKVPDCDLSAYDQMISEEVQSDLDAGIPEDWA